MGLTLYSGISYAIEKEPHLYEKQQKTFTDLPVLIQSLKIELSKIDVLNESISKKELTFSNLLVVLATRTIRTSLILKQFDEIFKIDNPKFKINVDRIQRTHDNLHDILLKNRDRKAIEAQTQSVNLRKIIELLIKIISVNDENSSETAPEKDLMIRYLKKFIECIRYLEQALSVNFLPNEKTGATNDHRPKIIL